LAETIAGVFEEKLSVVIGEDPAKSAVGELARLAFQVGAVTEKPDETERQDSEENEEAEADRDRFGTTNSLLLAFREKVNRWREGQVTADHERVEADHDAEGVAIAKSPNDKSKAVEGRNLCGNFAAGRVSFALLERRNRATRSKRSASSSTSSAS
jgi:hypothetical protein